MAEFFAVSPGSAPHERAGPALDAPGGASTDGESQVKASSLLDAVNAEAKRLGVREGQSIAEARAFLANLLVRAVPRELVQRELGRIAEMVLAFGPLVSFEEPDTVWVDVTGSAHLFGGEAAVAAEISSRVRSLGHVVRVAIADGPLLARAFARWSTSSVQPAGSLSTVTAKARASEQEGHVIPSERTIDELAKLPVMALPLSADSAAWLARLGILTVGDIAALPRASAAARLGSNAAQVLALCQGRDDAPLLAHQPERVLVEESSWEEPVSGFEPLLFVLKGLASRLSARLSGRGEAARALILTIRFDRSIALLNDAEPSKTLHFDLASPLYREEELRRVVASRLERMKLPAPTLGLRLEVPAIVPAVARQLDLSSVSKGLLAGVTDHELSVLLAELGADIGKERVGVLKVLDAHCPEAQSALFAADLGPRKNAKRGVRKTRSVPPVSEPESTLDAATHDKVRSIERPLPLAKPLSMVRSPTRLLPAPVRLRTALRVGGTLAIDHRLYTIEHVAFERRLEGVKWWSNVPISRDYVRLWLNGKEGGIEALVYVDRESGARYLQAIAD
jgi:protein ImuB